VNVGNYLQYVPEIEKKIVDNKLDSIVFGMGPTAWLLPYIQRSLLSGLRLWGAHDACRIMPADDLVIMDSPTNSLHPDTTRHRHIIDARPKRVWIYLPAHATWKALLHPSMHSVTEAVDWAVWKPECLPPDPRFKLEAPEHGRIHTLAVSPTGTTTLAWREGCRRIGVIGVDMVKGHHHTYQWSAAVARFFAKCAQHAHERGGAVVNLSPITSLKEFAEWTPSESLLEPTSGNEPPEQNSSSSTASDSTASATTSKSPGCGPGTEGGKSARPAESKTVS